jgi:DNA invertase Pin-like site-specific DNA recombinase
MAETMSGDSQVSGAEPAGSVRPDGVRPHHLQKLAIVYIRQSTFEQVRHNTGSTAVQLDLAELPRRWGWPESRIRVIDEDLGLSGTSVEGRDGFKDLIRLIKTGQVGIVFVRDVSRLSRDNADSALFFRAARRAQILIYFNGGLHDAATKNPSEIFGLQLHGLLAQWENESRVHHFQMARVAKARQGVAVSRPPIGYTKSTHGRWIKDPDTRVQDVIRLVFELSTKMGSLQAVAKSMQGRGVLLPVRKRGALTWEPASRVRIYSVLTNPRYSGRYVYQQNKIIPGFDGEARRVEPRPESEWIVVENHHEPYLPYDEWRAINDALASRRPAERPIVGRGPALLQGLLECGHCSRWIKTTYSGRKGEPRVPSYLCRTVDKWGKAAHAVTCSARLLDQAVVRVVLAALKPAEIDAALALIEDACAEEQAVGRHRGQQLDQAEREVTKARQQHETARNPLVRADLEQRYAEALERRDKLKERFAGVVSTPVTITPADAGELRALTEHIEELWYASTTTNDERKRVLRTVITKIHVLDVNKERIQLEIEWIGGFRQPLEVLRPKGVDRIVLQLHEAGHDAKAIAEQLNARGLTTAKGVPFTRSTIYAVLDRHGMRRKDARQMALLLIRQMVIDNVPRTQMLARLAAEAPNVLGQWTPQRLYQCVSALYRGIPGVPPLPTPLPAEQDKQAAIDLIRRRHDEGASWTSIAGELNASGLRPPRASAFTAPQVARLFSCWQKQYPQGGPGGTTAT